MVDEKVNEMNNVPDNATETPQENVEVVEDKWANWQPKTELGKKVKSGEITSIYQILDSGQRILEPEIVDYLVPDLKVEFILIGQAKGKFGGGKRIVLKKVQKKTAEGNKQRFVAMAVVGNEKGIVGLGVAKARESVPAKEKAIRNAKLNLIHVPLGCGSWECDCGGMHSIPLAVSGRSSSVRITIQPAPKGTGLVVEKEVAKLLRLAGIKDARAKARGQTRTKFNLLYATFKALKKLSQIKMHQTYVAKIKYIE